MNFAQWKPIFLWSVNSFLPSIWIEQYLPSILIDSLNIQVRFGSLFYCAWMSQDPSGTKQGMDTYCLLPGAMMCQEVWRPGLVDTLQHNIWMRAQTRHMMTHWLYGSVNHGKSNGFTSYNSERINWDPQIDWRSKLYFINLWAMCWPSDHLKMPLTGWELHQVCTFYCEI